MPKGSSSSVSGGCGKQIRGEAAYHREFVATVPHTSERQAMNSVIHCQNTTTANCPNAQNAQQYLKK